MKPEVLVDTWFRLFSPTVRFPETIKYPASGNVGGFTYQPYTKWEAPSLYRGDDAVEQRIYREIASPGRQLGKLTDVALQLADQVRELQARLAELETARERLPVADEPIERAAGAKTAEIQPDEAEEIQDLRKLAVDIDTVKQSATDNAAAIAKDNLDRLLAKKDPRLKSLMEEYLRKLDQA